MFQCSFTQGGCCGNKINHDGNRGKFNKQHCNWVITESVHKMWIQDLWGDVRWEALSGSNLNDFAIYIHICMYVNIVKFKKPDEYLHWFEDLNGVLHPVSISRYVPFVA